MWGKVFELVRFVVGYVIPAVRKEVGDAGTSKKADEFREKRDAIKKTLRSFLALVLFGSVGAIGTCCSRLDIKENPATGLTDIYFSPNDRMEGSVEFGDGTGLESISLHFLDAGMVPAGVTYKVAVRRQADGVWVVLSKDLEELNRLE